jgi:hypothetical protein
MLFEFFSLGKGFCFFVVRGPGGASPLVGVWGRSLQFKAFGCAEGTHLTMSDELSTECAYQLKEILKAKEDTRYIRCGVTVSPIKG